MRSLALSFACSLAGYDYLFEIAVKMAAQGIDATKVPETSQYKELCC